MADRQCRIISVCVALFFLLFGCAIQQKLMVPSRERSPSIELKPSFGLSDKECPIRFVQGTLWFCTHCTVTRVIGIHQVLPVDAPNAALPLIQDDLILLLYMSDFKGLRRRIILVLPQMLPDNFTGMGPNITYLWDYISDNSFCGTITPAIRRFGLIDVLGSNIEGHLENKTVQGSLEENDIFDAEDIVMETGLQPPDSVDFTKLMLILLYTLAPLVGIFPLILLCWRWCYARWRHNRDIMPPVAAIELQRHDNGFRE